ncbi:MAG: DUF4272 domain-containing protein [Myxococcota bacterium]
MTSALLAVALMLSQASPPTPSGPHACFRSATADQAARRAVALSLLASRAWLELKLPTVRQETQVKELHRRHKQLRERVKALALDSSFTARERELMARPLGGWDSQELADTSWAMEQAGTLLWALGRHQQLPAYHQPMTMDEALKPITAPGAAEELLRAPRLRAPAELARVQAESELFVWRAREESARRREQTGTEVPTHVTEAIRQARERQTTVRTDGTDLTVGPRRVVELDAAGLKMLLQVASARRDALSFVCAPAS